MEQQQSANKPRWYQGKAFNGSMGVIDFGLTYHDRRKYHADESKFVSAGISAASAAAWMYVPGIMWAKMAVDAGKGAGSMIENYRRQSYESQLQATENRGIIGTGFQDTEIGYTTRQRGVQAIQSSRLNARSALSNEARSLHRL